MIAPDDAEYDAARTVFAGGVDRLPAVIVRAADAADIAHIVTLARKTGLELAVRSGGHSNAGYGVSEGGIVLDLREIRSLDVDPEGRTAWAGAGLTAGPRSAPTASRPASATPARSGWAGSPWATPSAISSANAD